MGFRLTITLRSERKFVVLSRRPVLRWCRACGAESRFVDEEAEAALAQLTAGSLAPHRIVEEGRKLICLNSISSAT